MVAPNVFQLSTPTEMERYLLDVLAKVRKGDVIFLAVTYADDAGEVVQRQIPQS